MQRQRYSRIGPRDRHLTLSGFAILLAGYGFFFPSSIRLVPLVVIGGVAFSLLSISSPKQLPITGYQMTIAVVELGVLSLLLFFWVMLLVSGS